MKIAINSYPLKSGHKTRGVGSYTKNLLENLKDRSDIEIQEFTNLAEVKKADVIHYPWFDLFFKTLVIHPKIPTIVTVHDLIPLVFSDAYPVGIKGKINFHFQKNSLKKSKFIITDSEKSKADIINFFSFDKDKIYVIPLAVEDQFRVLSDSQKIRFKMKYNLPDKFILYVGDANFVKNLPFLIEGFNKLGSEGFDNLKLVLVGQAFLKNVENIAHPELRSLKEVNELIKTYHLDQKILRLGQITTEDLVGIYNLATVYVQPSLYEGFGLPILEAMSCGTPVVSSTGGSLPEVGNRAVSYFDPKRIDNFVNVLKEVLNDSLTRQKLSRLGLKESALFSWKHVAAKTVEVYEKTLI